MVVCCCVCHCAFCFVILLSFVVCDAYTTDYCHRWNISRSIFSRIIRIIVQLLRLFLFSINANNLMTSYFQHLWIRTIFTFILIWAMPRLPITIPMEFGPSHNQSVRNICTSVYLTIWLAIVNDGRLGIEILDQAYIEEKKKEEENAQIGRIFRTAKTKIIFSHKIIYFMRSDFFVVVFVGVAIVRMSMLRIFYKILRLTNFIWYKRHTWFNTYAEC